MLQRLQLGQRSALIDGVDVVDYEDGELRSIIMRDGFTISEIGGVSDVIVVRDQLYSAEEEERCDGRWRKKKEEKVQKKRRGRPLGSKNKPKSNNYNTSIVLDSNSLSSTSSSGGVVVVDVPQPAATRTSCDVLRPHVLEISAGCDIAESVAGFVVRRRSSLCLLSATGCVSNVRLGQAPKSHATATASFEGSFDILSVGGSYVHREEEEEEGRAAARGFMSMSLAGEEGRVVGGSVEGAVAEGGPVVIVAALFFSSASASSSSSWEEGEAAAAEGGVVAAAAAEQDQRRRRREKAYKMGAAHPPSCHWWPDPKEKKKKDEDNNNKLLTTRTIEEDDEDEDAPPPWGHYPSIIPSTLLLAPPPRLPLWNHPIPSHHHLFPLISTNHLHTTPSSPPPNPILLHRPNIDAACHRLLRNRNSLNGFVIDAPPPQNHFLPSTSTIASIDMVHGTSHHPFSEWAASCKDYLSSTRTGNGDTQTNSQPYPLPSFYSL